MLVRTAKSQSSNGSIGSKYMMYASVPMRAEPTASRGGGAARSARKTASLAERTFAPSSGSENSA